MEVKLGKSRENLGGSLAVDNVQALAAMNLDEIPERYIRPEVKEEGVSVEGEEEIPVIDLGRLLNPEFKEEEMEKLHLACQHWGFFQLINHEVREEVMVKMKETVAEFFKLPLEEKKAYSQLPNNIEGYGQAFVLSQEQKLDWGDMLFLVPRPIPQRNMKLWPTQPPSFRETLEEYSCELQRVVICLLELMGEKLGIDGKKMREMFEEGMQGVRMNYYPPCLEADKVLGISPHSDADALTLLIQANEVQGLQIKKNGNWVPVKPLPAAFIVNVGDITEILSNGKYKSIEHRAVINPSKERLSIAGFHNPKFESTIGPLMEMTQDGEASYKTMSNEDYMRLVVSSKLDGKSLLDFMKLK